MTQKQGWMIVRTLIVTISTIGALWLLMWLFSLTYPFIIGAILAWMLKPLSKWLKERLRFPSPLAALVTLLTGVGGLAGVLTGVTFLSIYGFQQFSERVPEWVEQSAKNIQSFFNETIWPFWQDVIGLLDALTPEQQATLQEGIIQLGTQLGSVLAQIGQGIADGLTQVALAFPSFLIGFLFTLLGMYFISKDWDTLAEGMTRKLPPALIERMEAFILALRVRVLGFLRAQIILMSITTIIVFIGFLLLRVEYPFILAIIVGIAEILPYLGTGTILIPWFIYLFITGEITFGLAIAILYLVAVVVRQSIEPKVLSFSMNLNALAVLISLFAGLQIFGFVGLFIGPGLLVVLVILRDIGVAEDMKSIIRDGLRKEEK
ncbi:sporulation integral membrane protein YtvI [Salsuginibacillus kocurii]|uniref:sporulation integral membrane protein YtvI n=1 Tax=Salsuginibacillus kocurii TaxID=427078 RepID=UPI00037A04F6|nr:sporulation integral membrane protein YtvI [Salsuginibacillus kocurii]